MKKVVSFLVLLLLPITASAGVDLVVNHSDSPDPVAAGGIVTYSVRVTNDSFDTDATGVTSTHSVPAGVTYQGVTGAGVSCTGVTVGNSGPGTLNCTLPNLAQNGGESTFDISLKTTAQGSITLGAVAASAEVDDQPANNTDNETTTVNTGADVTLSKTPANTSAAAGSSFTWALSFTNNGPDAAVSQRISDPVPSGFSVTSLPGGCANNAGTIICDVAGPIGSGATHVIGNLTGIITAASSSTVTNTASIALSPGAPLTAPRDPDAANNTAVANVTVTAGTDLAISKSRDIPGNLLVGDNFNFVLSPSYTGDSPNTITVTDNIPVNYTIGAVANPQNGWTCGVAGQLVTCTKPSGSGSGVLNQSLGTITIPVTVASSGANISNTATISTVSPNDQDLSNNSATDGGVTLLDPTVDLGLTKSGPTPALVVAGVPFDFSIVASNSGNTDFFGDVVVTDTIPANLTVNSYTLNGWSCLPAAPVVGPNTITCSRTYTALSPLAGGSSTPAVTLTAEVANNGAFTNSATVTTPNCNLASCNDGDISNYSVTSSIGGNSADIRLLKSVDLANIPAGDVLTYTLEVVNDGPQTSNAAVLTDTFGTLISNGVGPAGEGYISEVISAGLATGANCSNVASGSNGRALTCNFATIPVCTAGTNCPTVTIQVRPGGDGGARTNTANVISNGTADPDHSNETASAANTIDPRADITVAKTVSPTSVPAGQNLTYVIATPNSGPSRAGAVSITDTLPLDVTFVSATPSSGSCPTTPGANVTTTGINRTLICNLGNVNNGSQQTVTVVVRPNSITRGTTITNNVVVSTTTTEVPGGAANNSDAINADVTNPSLDLVLNKVDSVDPVAAGDDTVYTVTVTNQGPSAAEDVIIADTLPATGLSFQSVVPSAGACPTQPAPNAVGGAISCDIGYLAAGATASITVAMTGVAKGVVTNNASVTSLESIAGFDTNGANNSVNESTTVRTKADMEVVSKTPSVGSVNIRDNFNFVIVVRNNAGAGLVEADNVVVSDTLPAGMELTGPPAAVVTLGSASSTACSGVAGNNSFNCNLGTVSSGGVVTITVPVQLVTVSSIPQTFTNTASVTTSSLDTVPANNSNTGNIDVNSSSIAGRVFRDFNHDDTPNGADSGISGITMTLTGTTFDGAPINRTVVTDANGDYAFDGVAQGNYTITEGAIPANEHVIDGGETAGTSGGSTATNDQIATINLPANTAATGYLFAEVPVPLIGLAKAAGGVVNNLDGTYSVPFTLTVENSGGTPLSAVQITDDLTADFGTYTSNAIPVADEYTISAAPTIINPSNGAVLSASAAFTGSGANRGLLVPAGSDLPNFGNGTASAAQVQFTLRFFPTTPGPFNNTAVAEGTSPAAEIVTDDSVNGADPDPTADDDPTNDASPTPVNLFGQSIGVAKIAGNITQTGLARFKVPYSIIVSNTSAATTATNVQVSDNLNTTFPTAQSIAITTPAVIGGCTGTVLTVAAPAFSGTGQNNLLTGNQNLQIGESCTIIFVVEVDFGTNSLPAVDQNNQAVATTSQTPGGIIIDTDLSDDGVIPDGDGDNEANEPGENDPTPVNFSPAALSSVSGKVWRDNNHDRVDNDGPSSPVSGFIVEVVNAAGMVVGTATTAADGTYTVSNLFPSTPGDPATEYSVRFRDPVSGGIYGLPVSEDPTPALNGTINNGVITGLQLASGNNTLNQSLPLDPSGVIYDSVSRQPISGASVTLTTGGIAVPGACLVGGLNTQVTGVNGFYQYLLLNPAPPGCPGNGTYTIEVTQPGGYLPPESVLIPATAGPYVPTNGGVDAIQAQAGPPTGADPTTYYFDITLNLGVSSAVVNNHIPLDPILGGAIVITKTTPKKEVVRGELVPYTITAANTLSATLTNIALQDQIPAGFKYVDGSATIDGVKSEPVVTGRSLVWSGLTFPPSDTKTIQLILIIGSGVSEGEYVNQAWANNTVASARVSNVGSATVRVVPDPLFDCSDLIGKVFDDKNINGYQDEGEPGLAGIRVATVRGLLVTTDNYGRFHIACADVPNELHGSNFIMKLDERTLPSGYRVTTENPRVVRLTRGKLVKLNFGAALHRVIRIDLNKSSFSEEDSELTPASDKQLTKLIEILKKRPSLLRLTYVMSVAEERFKAHERMQLFVDKVSAAWQQCDCKNYELTIEQELLDSKISDTLQQTLKGAKK